MTSQELRQAFVDFFARNGHAHLPSASLIPDEMSTTLFTIAGMEQFVPVFLGEAVLRLLRALAPQAGCVLVLEDLHWADQETLTLLEYLADNLAAERVLCLATLREAGYQEGGEAAALASALAARGSAAMLALGRLGPTAMADMARACLDTAHLPAAVHEFVAGRAEGIPFLVEEVLAGLVGEGALTERDGRWHAADLSTPGVPATFADAVRRRLDGMSAESRRVIGAAAVLTDRSAAPVVESYSTEAAMTFASGRIAGFAAAVYSPTFVSANADPARASSAMAAAMKTDRGRRRRRKSGARF